MSEPTLDTIDTFINVLPERDRPIAKLAIELLRPIVKHIGPANKGVVLALVARIIDEVRPVESK
jgi:flagellar biosynthesis/type III secretory pathway protein FliH